MALAAFENSTRALTLIQAHTQECAVRYGLIIKIMGWGLSTTILLLLGGMAYFLTRFGLPGAG